MMLLSRARPFPRMQYLGHHDVVGVNRSITYNHSYIRTYVFFFYFIQNGSQLSQITILLFYYFSITTFKSDFMLTVLSQQNDMVLKQNILDMGHLDREKMGKSLKGI